MASQTLSSYEERIQLKACRTLKMSTLVFYLLPGSIPLLNFQISIENC